MGKWTLRPCSHGGMILDRGEGDSLPMMQIVPEEHAHLIAASPDLYAALDRIVTAVLDGKNDDAFQIAQFAGYQALRKARGGDDAKG